MIFRHVGILKFSIARIVIFRHVGILKFSHARIVIFRHVGILIGVQSVTVLSHARIVIFRCSGITVVQNPVQKLRVVWACQQANRPVGGEPTLPNNILSWTEVKKKVKNWL